MTESVDAGTNTLEARVARLEDLFEIHQLFIDYGEYLDAGDFEAYASLFADDGEVLLGPIGRAKGPAAIQELMTRTLAGKAGTSLHIISSPKVTLSGDTANSTVMWSVAVIGDDGQPRISMVGHHIDQLVRTPNGWKFQRRRGMVNLPSVMPATATGA